MGKIQATDRARAVFNSIKKRPGVVVTQSFLRLEQTLGTTGSVNFEVLVNQGAQSPTEKRLAITDSFSITSLAVCITKQASGGKVSAATLETFPNPLTFNGAGEAAALMSLYNGYLTARVNSTIYIDSLDIYRFYRVGVAQADFLRGGEDTAPMQAQRSGAGVHLAQGVARWGGAVWAAVFGDVVRLAQCNL